MQTLQPNDKNELASIIRDAKGENVRLEIIGSGSKRAIGRPVEANYRVSSAQMSGITLYQPKQRMLSVKAGTHLDVIEDALEKYQQILGFEPVNLGGILNTREKPETIGGILATNISGSRQIHTGSAKNHLLSLRGVNGFGQIINAGGDTIKHVTGYDLRRALTGTWGTLVFMTDITLRTLPKPEQTQTLIFSGLLDVLAIELMNKAMATPYEISGAMHLQAPLVKNLTTEQNRATGQSLTALRLENFSFSTPCRMQKLQDLLGPFGDHIILDDDESHDFWSDMRTLKFFHNSKGPLWRIAAAPNMASEIVSAIKSHHPESIAAYDCAGGIIWLQTPLRSDAGASEVHRAVLNRGGNATLIRADKELRSNTYVFQPVDTQIKSLMKRIKMAFDPFGILNPGRIYEDI
ncbi:MAG: FAD-binding protein [Pseudomonadota bacterium]